MRLFLSSPSILTGQLSFSSFSPFSSSNGGGRGGGRQHFLSKLRFKPLFAFKTLHCFDLLLTLDLLCDPRRTPWRLWERRSVGWLAVRTMPSMLTWPSLPVSKLTHLCPVLSTFLNVSEVFVHPPFLWALINRWNTF